MLGVHACRIGFDEVKGFAFDDPRSLKVGLGLLNPKL